MSSDAIRKKHLSLNFFFFFFFLRKKLGLQKKKLNFFFECYTIRKKKLFFFFLHHYLCLPYVMAKLSVCCNTYLCFRTNYFRIFFLLFLFFLLVHYWVFILFLMFGTVNAISCNCLTLYKFSNWVFSL